MSQYLWPTLIGVTSAIVAGICGFSVRKHWQAWLIIVYVATACTVSRFVTWP